MLSYYHIIYKTINKYYVDVLYYGGWSKFLVHTVHQRDVVRRPTAGELLTCWLLLAISRKKQVVKAFLKAGILANVSKLTWPCGNGVGHDERRYPTLTSCTRYTGKQAPCW